VFACLAWIGCHAQAQDSSQKYPLNIPRQGLTSALQQLSDQTHVYYGYSPDSTAEEQIQVGPVVGEYTIEQALTEMLRPTRLTFSWINSKNIAIVRAPPPPPPKVESQPPKPPRAARQAPAATPPVQTHGDDIIEEVITWGANYLGANALSPPVLVIGREPIEHSGATNVMQLLRILPQQPFLRPDGFRSNGAQYAELRGLDPDMSLVLINGRRAFASAASFSANAFDLNQIPLSAVERVEVMLDSISVRHGADAIGGIINIVLRGGVQEPSVEVHYGAAGGGGEQAQGTISAGAGVDNARATVILDYVDGQPLFGGERDLWRNQDYRRFGSIDQRSTISSPGNVFPAIPGTLLPGGAPFAAIPEDANRTTTLLDGLLPFELNRESLLQYFPIVAEDRRASAVATAQANVTPDLVVAADLMFVDRRVVYGIAPPVVGAVVPPTNPYNFVGQPVLVTALLEGVDPTRLSLDSVLIRGAGSLHGKLKQGNWDLSLLRSEEDARQRIDNVVDPMRLARVLANSDPERTLDLLGGGPGGSPELLASVLAPPQIDNLATDATQLTGSLGGNLLAIPAGAVSGVVGGEWRKEAVEFDSLLGSFDREVTAGFAEVHIPLLSERMQLPAAREVTMTVAGRFDRYTDFGDIFSPQFRLVWKPLRDIGIRGTYGRSFRAPAMYQLYLPRTPTKQALSDPRRKGEAYLADQLVGGSPDLEATRGKSFTAGIELTPEALKPLALSATYWHLELDSRVTALAPTFVLLHEFNVPGRVLRAAPTAADLAAGLPGRVLQIDTTFMNFGSLTTSGVDLGASYAFDTLAGHFAADLKGTWIDQYDALDLPGQAPMDRVNVANTFGTIAQWRAIASLDWQSGALGATTYVRYIPSYDDTRDGVRNGRTIPSQTFLDLQFSLDLGRLLEGSALLRGLKFTGGAMNALNQEPHFAEVNGIQGYDTSQGDLKGRFWYLRLGKTF
jgi:iron complex outermembrane recepter protein